MTLDGNCDHTAGIPDEDLHLHYANLLDNASAVLYGRITYELMQFWQPFLTNPSGQKPMDDFAVSIDKTPKVVFSRTMKETGWKTATLATKNIEEELAELKQQPGKDILIGSRSIIIQLLNLQLIDELQICIHPVLEGRGLQLFENIDVRSQFRLLKSKTFASGAIVLYYEPIRS